MPNSATVYAPDIEASAWLNTTGEPPSVKSLTQAGRVVLVDFWDYTCVNCLHTLHYLKAWHQRYEALGLSIMGVHTPEFEFATDAAHVAEAVKALGLPYPIALDNDYTTWQAYANKYWPCKYLIAPNGAIVFDQSGEGAYPDFERQIQAQLQAAHPDKTLDFPEPVALRRPLDDLTVKAPRPTPELYCGYTRGVIGNSEAYGVADSAASFRLPEPRLSETLYLQGGWFVDKQCLQFVGEEGAPEVPGVISLTYKAAEVNAVMHPNTTEGVAVPVALALDGKPLPPDLWGEDVRLDEATQLPTVWVDKPRMYKLLKADTFHQRELRLQTRSPGLRVYAFTFVSAPGECGIPGSTL